MKLNIEVRDSEIVENGDKLTLLKEKFKKDLVKLLKEHYPNSWDLEVKLIN